MSASRHRTGTGRPARLARFFPRLRSAAMNATYVSPTDTAKLIRAALKRSFPRTKFSVRTDTYAGGAAVDVS